eukprot:m.249655 g.249655  ORF g.249655 m.249655 type:complete len:58 (-) comp16239_c0_seq1:310-483(-)
MCSLQNRASNSSDGAIDFLQGEPELRISRSSGLRGSLAILAEQFRQSYCIAIGVKLF